MRRGESDLVTRYERYVELPQPLFEEGGGHVGVAGLAGLPLVVATLHHRHLVVVGRDAEDSLGVQTAQSWSNKQSVSKSDFIFVRLFYRESGL